MKFSVAFFGATLLAGAWSLPGKGHANHFAAASEGRYGQKHQQGGDTGAKGWGVRPSGFPSGRGSGTGSFPSRTSGGIAPFSTSSATAVVPTSSSVVVVTQSSTFTSVVVSSSSAAVAPTSSDAATTSVVASSASETDYDETWSGAVILGDVLPSGEQWKTIVGSFVVPTLSTPDRSGNEYTSSAWIGIDGTSDEGGLLQSGVDFVLESSGEVSYNTWVEWYPDGSIYFDDFEVSAGDSLTFTVIANSTSKGTIFIDNNTTGSTASKTLTAPDSSSTLELQSVEWIMEDFEYGYSGEILVDWGTLTFTGCSATTDDGTTYGPEDADWILDIEQDNTIYSTVTIDSSTEVTITYVG